MKIPFKNNKEGVVMVVMVTRIVFHNICIEEAC
jgi:hypothetical protein